MAESQSARSPPKEAEQMYRATGLHTRKGKQISQQQPDPDLVSKLILKTQTTQKSLITAMERL